MSVAILGPAIDHQQSLVEMLSGRVGCLTVLPDSHSHVYSRGAGWASRFQRSIDQLWHTRNADYLAHVCAKLDEARTDTLVAYWGTNPLSDVLAVRKLRPSIKLVLMVLCHPLTLNNLGLIRQQWMMRRAARQLDGFLFPCAEMAQFFEQTVLSQGRPPWTILPPCWPRSFIAKQRCPPLSDKPNVIFIGRTDLSHHTAHAADDIRGLMRELLDVGIDLHHVRSGETDDGHPRRKPFQPLAQADLIATMGQHDASLIVYNTQACARDERFRLTVPDRLITSVSAGLPIAIPAQGYEGAKSYLSDYPAVLTFDSPQDLKQQLSDRARVRDLKEAAWSARGLYAADRHGERLHRFLAGLP